MLISQRDLRSSGDSSSCPVKRAIAARDPRWNLWTPPARIGRRHDSVVWWARQFSCSPRRRSAIAMLRRRSARFSAETFGRCSRASRSSAWNCCSASSDFPAFSSSLANLEVRLIRSFGVVARDSWSRRTSARRSLRNSLSSGLAAVTRRSRSAAIFRVPAPRPAGGVLPWAGGAPSLDAGAPPARAGSLREEGEQAGAAARRARDIRSANGLTGISPREEYALSRRAATTDRSGRALLGLEDQRQAGAGAADHDHLCVGAVGQLLGRLDPLPFQELRADPRRHDALEVGDPLRLDPLALRLLLLLLENERHPQRVLLRLLLRLDRLLEHRRELDVAQQHVLDDDAARTQLALQLLLHLLRHFFAGPGVQRVGVVGRGGGADGRAQHRLDDDVDV